MNSYNDKEEKIIEMIKNLIDSGVSDRLIVSRFEFKILNLKNPKLYFWFAKNVKGIDIESNEQTVIDKIDPEWSYKFARDIAGANIKTHEQIVINSGDPEWNYKFARYIAGANVKTHEQIVINSGDPEWNYKFARYIAGADVKAHEQVVFKYGNQIESELELLDNYLDDAIASSEKDTSKSMTK